MSQSLSIDLFQPVTPEELTERFDLEYYAKTVVDDIMHYVYYVHKFLLPRVNDETAFYRLQHRYQTSLSLLSCGNVKNPKVIIAQEIEARYTKHGHHWSMGMIDMLYAVTGAKIQYDLKDCPH